ncbi:MAG: hypothetical protein WA951_15730 [Leeuwenhoekiella sp.]
MRFFIILFCFTPQIYFCQEIKVDHLREKELNTDQFVGVDEYNNVYSITNRVFYKTQADKTYQFSALELGKIASVDLLNPLRITVFYDQSNTAVILDNTLNEITRVNFNQLENFRNVSFARTASDRRLWIFNVDLLQLELFDYQSNRVLASSPPFSRSAENMTSNFNTCYVYTGKDLKIFNNYGSLLSTLQLKNLSLLDQNEGTIVAVIDGNLNVLDKNDQKFKGLPLNEKQVKQLYYANEFLYIYDGKILKTYTLNLPKN